MSQSNLLAEVETAAADLREARKYLPNQAAEWVASELDRRQKALDRAILAALEMHTVLETATAYTPEGRTPNRNAIYAVRDRGVTFEGDIDMSEYPFQWSDRTVKTINGERTVWDVQLELEGVGPDKITGTWTWRYDRATGSLEQVLDIGSEPYPETNPYYGKALQRWFAANPYPEDSE